MRSLVPAMEKDIIDKDFFGVCGQYDTVSDVVESEVHQCQQNSDA